MSDKPEGSGAPPLATRTDVERGLAAIETLLSVDPHAMNRWLEEHPAESDALLARFKAHLSALVSGEPRAAPLEPLADLPEKEK